MRTKIRKYLITITVLLVLSIASVVFLVHQRVWGFREAMEWLVLTKTNGQYKLVMNEYSIKLNPFFISFDQLQLIKNDSSTAHVNRFTVDRIILKTGSLLDFLRNNQLEIETLIVENPMIELIPGATPKSKGVHFSQQIVKLYPAVLAILEHFNVVRLEIKEGDLDIKSRNNADLQLKLIDLLITHWNVREFSEDSQLRLTMGPQQVGLNKGSLSFSGLQYDFKKRELLFSDFQYLSSDPSGNARIHAAGDYIAFKHLDYHELFHNQRLVYEKIIFQHPTIRARLQQHASKKGKQNTQQLISDFVANTVGEFSLDSATVANASIQLSVLSDHDSLVIDIPDLTIHTNKIRILPNQPIHIGDIDVHMKRSHVQLKSGLSISFADFRLDLDKTMMLKELQLNDYRNNRKIAEIPFTEFNQVDLVSIIEGRRLELTSVKLQDAQVWIDGGKTNPSETPAKPMKYPEISIEKLDLSNLSLAYRAANEQVFADGVNVTVNNISSNPSAGIQFSISKVEIKDTEVQLPTKQVTFQGKGIVLDGSSVSASRLNVTKGKLNILLNNLLVEHQHKINDPRTIDHLRWKSIRLGDLEISGTPEFASQEARSPSKFVFATHTVEISRILLNLHRGDTTVTGSFANLLIQHVGHSTEQPFTFTELSATSRNLQLKAGPLNASISVLDVRWPQQISADDVEYSNGDQVAALGTLRVAGIAKKNDTWSSASIALSTLHYSQEGILASLDSAHVDSFLWYNKKPRATYLELYRPEIKLTSHHSTEKDQKDKKGQASVSDLLPDRIVVHPGKVELADGNKIQFGTILGNLPEKRITIQSIGYHAPKNSISVSNFVLSSNSIQIDTFAILPNEPWYTQNNLEFGKVYMKMSDVKLPGQVFDSLLFKRRFNPAVLDISNFDLLATKDKRLPDPPEVEKPWSLSSLIKHPLPVPIQSVHIHDGYVRVEETSDKTGQTGKVEINDVRAKIDIKQIHDYMDISVDATARLYNTGKLQLNYQTIDPDTFKMQVRLHDFDLRQLNDMVSPTLSVKIKSGTVNRYFSEIKATNESGKGAAGIAYKKLHIEIDKPAEEKRNAMLSFIADNVVVTNSKKWVVSEFEVERIKHKSVFGYWVRLASKGAIQVIVNGR